MNNIIKNDVKDLYLEALNALTNANIDFMLGGAFAVYYYTGWWRDTHDIDVYILPEEVNRAAEVLSEAGFFDLGEQAAGDEEWIYHAGKESMVIDLIFRFANMINYVSPDWFDRASEGKFLNMELKIVPIEELIWVKSFVINRHRCDWPDLLRIIRAQCSNINWSRLMELLGDNWLLLAGLVDIFDWQHPGEMNCIPDFLREEFARRRKIYRENPVNIDREHLLDPWLHIRADRYETWSNE